jgi:hypothetical protein
MALPFLQEPFDTKAGQFMNNLVAKPETKLHNCTMSTIPQQSGIRDMNLNGSPYPAIHISSLPVSPAFRPEFEWSGHRASVNKTRLTLRPFASVRRKNSYRLITSGTWKW